MPKLTAEGAIRVEGLEEFRAGLKKLGPEWPGKLGQINKRLTSMIVTDARNRASTAQAKKAAESLKASAGAKEAIVSLGGPGFEFALGAEFGALQYKQFPPWRGNQFAPAEGGVGYFLMPAIHDDLGKIEAAYLDAVGDLTKQAFPT